LNKKLLESLKRISIFCNADGQNLQKNSIQAVKFIKKLTKYDIDQKNDSKLSVE